MLDEHAASRAKAVSFAALALLAFAAFLALGVWQLQRRIWKLDLIERVQERVHALPEDAPAPPEWPAIAAQRDEYRHVRAAGIFVPGKEILVQAATDQGGGFWVMAPLRTTQGFTVFINRGFLPSERRDQLTRITGQTTVTGLLRMTEPRGAFLRSNDPAANRWYSRDVAAMAATEGLPDIAPYFIDAEATPGSGEPPIGGLTVIAFPNNHLVYAITWFALALLVAAGSLHVIRSRRVPSR